MRHEISPCAAQCCCSCTQCKRLPPAHISGCPAGICAAMALHTQVAVRTRRRSCAGRDPCISRLEHLSKQAGSRPVPVNQNAHAGNRAF